MDKEVKGKRQAKRKKEKKKRRLAPDNWLLQATNQRHSRHTKKKKKKRKDEDADGEQKRAFKANKAVLKL